MKVSTQLRKVTRKDGSQIGIVYFRVRGEGKDLRASSSLTIDPELWDGEVPGYSASVISKVVSPIVAKEFNNRIQDILYAIKNDYSEDADAAWLNKVVNSAGAASMEPAAPSPNDDKREKNENEPTLLDYFALYLEKAEFHDWHRQAQNSVMHKLTRYEKWLGFVNDQPDFKLYLSDIDKEQIEDYKDYVDHEYQYYKTNPKFFKQFKLSKSIDIRPLSKNAVICHIKRLNMFLNWCVKMGYLTDMSFRNITCDQQLYGTPFYDDGRA